jgi:hypothetical protein
LLSGIEHDGCRPTTPINTLTHAKQRRRMSGAFWENLA